MNFTEKMRILFFFLNINEFTLLTGSWPLRLSRGHQAGESDDHLLVLGPSHGLCLLQAHLPAGGQPGRLLLLL